MILKDEEAVEIVKNLSVKKPDWVITARENNKLYKALVLGDNFCDVLIEKIEHIESKAKAEARKKYSKDIRDVFRRVMIQRENVFQSNGGSEKVLISNENIRSLFIKLQSNFKANKSVFKYLSENYFELSDIDPNGLLFLEVKDNKPYPTYKSINDIYCYESNGQKLEYVIFEPETKAYGDNNGNKRYWRIVDDENDRIIVEISGGFYISEKLSQKHDFGETPGLILSNKQKVGSELRYTNIEKIIELAKDFARDKSILNIYKFQKGYPIHWRFVSQCRTCTGTGKKNEGKCTSCDGHGYIKNTDVTDIVTLPIPDIDQPNIAPHIAGYESPDLETWKQYKEDMNDLVKVMKDTIWGTNLHATEKQQNLQETETATGRYIDVQPIINTLNIFSDEVEYVDNTLCNWLLNYIDPIKNKSEILYFKTYGRRFIIENPDVILKRYQEAKKTSDSNVILDKLLEEYIMSKYKNDQIMQNLMLKKKELEPYVHMSLDQVNTSFGPQEAYKKELFNKWWNEVDTTKEVAYLKKEFEAYVNSNKFIPDKNIV